MHLVNGSRPFQELSGSIDECTCRLEFPDQPALGIEDCGLRVRDEQFGERLPLLCVEGTAIPRLA
ncbi:hypothetical protein D3C71_2217210 [compost metagenome]